MLRAGGVSPAIHQIRFLVLIIAIWDTYASLAMAGIGFAFVLIGTIVMFIGLSRSVENFNLFQRIAQKLNEALDFENDELKKNGYKAMFGENFFWLSIKKEF